MEKLSLVIFGILWNLFIPESSGGKCWRRFLLYKLLQIMNMTNMIILMIDFSN